MVKTNHWNGVKEKEVKLGLTLSIAIGNSDAS